MTPIVGHAAAQEAFAAALASGHLHHAWLIAGPEGVGKARFARAAALRMLAEASGERQLAPGLAVPGDHPAAMLVAAGSHPDLRIVQRLAKDPDKPDDLARSIVVDQIRLVRAQLAMKSLTGRRIVIIDSADELEGRGAPNALLKSLEEPPDGTTFLLVSHAPGRLLATIRSRCRLLRFGLLGDDEMGDVIRRERPEVEPDELAALVNAGEGSPGRALRFAGLEISRLDAAIQAIAEDGDADNVRRSALGKALAAKAAQPRYAAFLDRAPAFMATEARRRSGPDLVRALDLQAKARDLAGAALGLSLDQQATVWEMAGLLAALPR